MPRSPQVALFGALLARCKGSSRQNIISPSLRLPHTPPPHQQVPYDPTKRQAAAATALPSASEPDPGCRASSRGWKRSIRLVWFITYTLSFKKQNFPVYLLKQREQFISRPCAVAVLPTDLFYALLIHTALVQSTYIYPMHRNSS